MTWQGCWPWQVGWGTQCPLESVSVDWALPVQYKKKKNKKSRNMASSSTLGPGLDLALLLAACGKISLQPQFHSSLTTKIMCTLEIMKVPSLNLTP